MFIYVHKCESKYYIYVHMNHHLNVHLHKNYCISDHPIVCLNVPVDELLRRHLNVNLNGE